MKKDDKIVPANDPALKINPGSDTGVKLSEKDSLAEEKVTGIFLALDEVKQLIRDAAIWKKTGRKFSWMVNGPDSTHADYIFQAGYDSDIRFETRYWIHIHPGSRSVQFLDTMSDSLFSPEDFRRLNN